MAGAFLAKQLSTAADNLTSGFSAGCPLTSIGSLSDHCLVDYCLVKRHSKNPIAYINMFNHFTSKAVNWNLHSLIFLQLIFLSVIARSWHQVLLP
jgi:hypothetical protein